jgi:hypothetical protein
MSIEITLTLTKDKYPKLFDIKKDKLIDNINSIIDCGYNIKFPNTDDIKENSKYESIMTCINNLKDELNNKNNNSEFIEKFNSFEMTLGKLIGLSSNSNKKGNFAENILEELFKTRYGDITFERKSGTGHSGDAWLHLPDNKIIMLESKNYNTVVNKDEVAKLQSDMINHNIRWGIMISFNSMIQGMKELDFHTFVHNNETYSVIMISNFSNDNNKLDLSLQIIRKLINSFDNISEFPWLVDDIKDNMNEMNKIIQKNYILRDNYYTMESSIQKSLSNYHTILRDYQYDLEQSIKKLTTKIETTMKDSIKSSMVNKNVLVEMYKNKKIEPIINRLVDMFNHKNWDTTMDMNEGNWIIKYKDIEKGRLKVQAKKAIINISNNDLELILHLDKEKENKQNIDIIKNL